jgi:hypothetical protein
MSIDHHELRRAFGQFLAARRAVHEAYRESVKPRGPAALMPARQWEAGEQAGDDAALNEELLELKHENEGLRKSLAVLYTYSQRVQEQSDTVLVHRNRLLDECEEVVPRMQDREYSPLA